MSRNNISGGKNNVVVKKDVPKKKRSCCCNCLIAILVSFVIFVGAGAGAGYYFGDKYAREYLDVGIKDVLGAFSDVMTSNGKKLVTYSYNDVTSDELEGGIKHSLFLKDSADLQKDVLLNQLMPSLGSSDSSKNAAAVSNKSLNASSYLYRALNETADDYDPALASDPFTEYISKLLTLENMDIESLKDYDEANHDDYLLSIKDKELAAFIADILYELLAEVSLEETNEMLSGVKLNDVVKLEQLQFYGTPIIPHIKLTVSFNARAVASKVISNLTGMGIGWLAKPVLPKLFYLTCDVAVDTSGEENSKAKIYINNTDDEKMERLYKIVRNATKLTGNELDIEKTLDDALGSTLSTIANALGQYADLSKVGEGIIQADIFELAINLAKLNEGKDEADFVTSPDIIYALKYILTSEFDNAVKDEHTWIDQYKRTGEVETVYRPADVTGLTLVDYEQEMLNEVADKYLIDLTNGTPDDPTDDKTFADLMTLFGMGGEGSGDLMDWIDASRLGEIAGRVDEETGLPADVSVVITDRMLGAMMNAQVNSLMSDVGAIADAKPRVYQVIISKSNNKTFMEVGMEINIKEFMGGASSVFDMLGSLIPERVMITVKIEITPDVAEDYAYAPSEMYYNDLSKAEVDRLLSTLSKLGVPLSEDEIIAPIETSMRDVITTMKKQMPGLEFESSAIIMADLFSLTLDLEINKDGADPLKYDTKDEHGNDIQVEMTGEDLREIISILYDDTDTSGFNAPSENHNGFLNDVIDKYFLVGVEVGEGDDPNKQYITTFDDLTSVFNMDNFNSSIMDLVRLKHTNVSNEDLRPIIEQSELAHIILSKMGDEFMGMKIISFNITNDDKIEIVAEIQTSSMFGSDNTAFEKFLTVEKMYLYIEIDLNVIKNDHVDVNGNPVTYYDCTVTINEMSDNQLSKMNALISHYDSSGSGLDLEKRAKDIGSYIYDELMSFKNNMGDNCEFVEGGVIIANIFDLIAQSQPYDDDNDPNTEAIIPDSLDVRGAIQGLSQNVNVEWENEFSVFNYDIDELVFNEAEQFNVIDIDWQGAPLSATILDNQLAYALANGMTSSQLSVVQDAQLLQVNLYSEFRPLPLDISFSVDNYSDTREYAAFTFSLTNWGTENTGGKNNYSDLIESTIYFTLIFERNGAGDFVIATTNEGLNNYIRINNLTFTQQEVLFNIANVVTTSFNDQIDNCEAVLSSILDGAFGASGTGNDMVGTVEVSHSLFL